MNVRELVTILKFKTDTATMKSAETAVSRIKETMAGIKPATLKVNTSEASSQITSLQHRMNSLKFNINTSGASKQIDTLQTKINSLRSTKTVKVNMNTSGAVKQVDTLNRKLAMVTGKKNLTVNSDTTGIDNATQALNRFSQAQTRASQAHFRGKAQGLAQTKQNTPQPATGGMELPIGALKGAFVALGGMALVNEIKQTADAMMSLSSRIRLVTQNDAERLKIESRLYAMSIKNRASLEDIGDLYYKTALSAQRFGATQEDVLRLTDIVSKSLIIGGADTAQQKSTILQLSQALGSGVLQGDELRSLRENAPILMDQISKFFGVSMAGLKEMGQKGELTTEKLMQAILASGTAVDAQMGKITPTIGQAITVLGNKWSKLILDIQNDTGIFGTIAGLILDAVDWVGEAIDFVKEQFKTIEPEFNGFVGSLKELWTEMQPLLKNLGEIFKNWIVPALRMFGKVALSVLGMVADLLKPIVNLLDSIAGLIADASKGFSGLINKAESGAIQRYNSIVTNQTNNVNVNSVDDAVDYVNGAEPPIAYDAD